MSIIGFLKNLHGIGFNLMMVKMRPNLLLKDLKKNKSLCDLDLAKIACHSLPSGHVHTTRMSFFTVWAWSRQLQVVFLKKNLPCKKCCLAS